LGTSEILLVTAIADPGPMLQKLSQKGIKYRHRKFGDHHYFTDDEIEEFNSAAMVLTTEKDFTRMGGKVPHAYYLPVEHRFFNDGKEQMVSLLQAL
jgi:tetraacyldisaccharide 4'-kinase